MVRMDCAFRIGKTHLVCQDYATVAAGEFPCVLLADGCSGSPDTDIGARLLVRSALSHLAAFSQQDFAQQDCGAFSTAASPGSRLLQSASSVNALSEENGPEGDLLQFHTQAICEAGKHASALNLSDMALDATLLTLMVCGPEWIASVYGDGVVVALNHAGEMEVTVISYLGGYPNYPSYLADKARLRTLLQNADNVRQTETFTIDADGGVSPKQSVTCAADAPCPVVVGNIADYRWVAILSDGIHSFYTTEPAGGHANTPLPMEMVLPELLAFKTSGGQFAQRRMQKFQQQCVSRGWQHHDDISIGVVSMS